MNADCHDCSTPPAIRRDLAVLSALEDIRQGCKAAMVECASSGPGARTPVAGQLAENARHKLRLARGWQHLAGEYDQLVKLLAA